MPFFKNCTFLLLSFAPMISLAGSDSSVKQKWRMMKNGVSFQFPDDFDNIFQAFWEFFFRFTVPRS